jgi:hypothetical protein
MAGIRNKNSHGAKENKPSRLAYPPHKTLFSPGISHKNDAVRSKYTAITIGPVSVEKNERNSFSNTANICVLFINLLLLAISLQTKGKYKKKVRSFCLFSLYL